MTDIVIVAFIRSVIVLIASATQKFFGFSGIFCDCFVGYVLLKITMLDPTDLQTAAESSYWSLLLTSITISIFLRLLVCGYVYNYSRRSRRTQIVVAPNYSRTQADGSGREHDSTADDRVDDRPLVAADRCDEFLIAVRFWLVLCDPAQNGYMTTSGFAQVLRALNGGKHTERYADQRSAAEPVGGGRVGIFDPEYLAEDLMRQMDSQYADKIYL
eukprot:SAG31_NODE_727_length_12536_cov_2.306022_6_plen_215_part_00